MSEAPGRARYRRFPAAWWALAAATFAPMALASDASVDIGATAWLQSVRPGDQRLALETAGGAKLRANASGLGAFAADVFEGSVRLAWGPLRIGPIAGLGVGWVSSRSVSAADLLAVDCCVRIIDVGVDAGIVIARRGRFQAELGVGAGAMQLDLALLHPDPASPKGRDRNEIDWWVPFFEPTAALEAWITERITLGLWGSVNLATPGEPGIGLAVTLHGDAYGAR